MIASSGRCLASVSPTCGTKPRTRDTLDASVERLKERIKLQIEQEQQNGQEVFDGPNEQDLDNMLDNLLIFDQ